MAYYYKNNKEINALVDYTVIYYKNSVFLLVIDCSLWFIRHYRVNHILNVTLTFKAYVSVLHYFYVILVSKCSPSKVLCFKAWSLVWYITILNHGFIGHLEGDGGINLVFRTSKICTSYRINCSFHDEFFHFRLICTCCHRQHSPPADYISRTRHGWRKLKACMLSFTITISLGLRRK